MSKQKLLVIATAALGILSLFLPFVKVLGTSVNAMKGAGALSKFLLVMYGVSIALTLLGKPADNVKKGSMIGIIICAAIALLFLFLNMANVAEMGMSVLGIGFWTAIIATLAMPIVMFVFKNK